MLGNCVTSTCGPILVNAKPQGCSINAKPQGCSKSSLGGARGLDLPDSANDAVIDMVRVSDCFVGSLSTDSIASVGQVLATCRCLWMLRRTHARLRTCFAAMLRRFRITLEGTEHDLHAQKERQHCKLHADWVTNVSKAAKLLHAHSKLELRHPR